MGKYQSVVQKLRAYYQIPKKYKWIGLTVENCQISNFYYFGWMALNQRVLVLQRPARQQINGNLMEIKQNSLDLSFDIYRRSYRLPKYCCFFRPTPYLKDNRNFLPLPPLKAKSRFLLLDITFSNTSKCIWPTLPPPPIDAFAYHKNVPLNAVSN